MTSPAGDDRQTKYVLSEDRIPRTWYNIVADLPVPPAPVLHPGTGQPIGPADLAPLFPMALIGQEVSAERDIEIPEPVRDAYRLYRPSPSFRARRLEAVLDTPAHIYYKYEGGSPAGSHKPNTAIAQAFYNKQEGTKRIATETGAGQWGSALAFAGALFDLEVKVYMVRASYDQKPYRRILMETYGASVVASPSPDTNYGRAVLAEHPDSPGSLGMAISEAVEDAATRDDTKYSLGLGPQPRPPPPDRDWPGSDRADGHGRRGARRDHRLRRRRLELRRPDLPVPRPDIPGRAQVPGHRGRAEAAPSLTRGVYAYDFGDTGKLTPLVKMFTLGADFIPEPIHAGGLRYHGMAPAGQPAQGPWRHRGAGGPPGPGLRGGRRLRPGRGHRPRARVVACDPGRDRRGDRGQGDGREQGDPVQPVGPRPLRPGRLRALPVGQPRGLRVHPRRGRPGEPAQGRLSRRIHWPPPVRAARRIVISRPARPGMIPRPAATRSRKQAHIRYGA